MRHILGAFFVVLVILLPWFAFNYPKEINYTIDYVTDLTSQLAAVVTHNPKTVAGLQSKYNVGVWNNSTKVRILLVPGHGPDYGGAEYGSIKERELVPVIANYLSDFLKKSGRYEVIVSRNSDSWNPIFTDYWKSQWNNIVDWQKSYKAEMTKMISLGLAPQPVSTVYHNSAPDDVAYKLYGITKWSNENDIDVVIHIHINDYPGHGFKSPGKYTGFVIYVPGEEYYNSSTTHSVADAIYKRLARYNPVSNLPGESRGIVDDPELIAIGANNTSNSANMLIEYGYLYEPQFTNPEIRDTSLKELAYETYLGLQDFFDPTNATRLGKNFDTLALPHNWSSQNVAQSSPSDIYSLQTALLLSGSYPPENKGLNDCPRSGTFGPCTKTALENFQKSHGIYNEKNSLGKKTLETLNSLFSISPIN